MNRCTQGLWATAILLGLGTITIVRADPSDRDGGRGRIAELRERLSRNEGQLSRNPMEKSVTGRELGRDTIERDMHKRDFRDANDMSQHMTEHTKQRATRTAGATTDEGATGLSFPNAGRTVSAPPETLARTARGSERPSTVLEHEAAPSIAGQAMLEKSATGRTLGKDTLGMADGKRDFKDRNDLMAHLNPQTKMRAERTAAARGEDTDGSRAFPNVGRTISDPSRMSPELRAAACRAGACIGKPAASADIEDKSK